EAHHDLDDLGDGDPERSGEILDADARRDRDRPGRSRDRLLPRLLRGRRAAIARLTPVAAPRVAAVDDDAALAARRAAAGTDGAIGLVGLVCHFSAFSVDAREIGIDHHGSPEYPVERAGCPRPLEAGEAATSVDTASRHGAARREA